MHKTSEIIVKTVSERNMLGTIYRIRYDAYLRKGYISPDPSGMKTDDWDEFSCTIHFAAFEKNRIAGSVRLVCDSAKGLPMEREFAGEIEQLRSSGKKVAEASALVVAEDARGNEKRIWLKLSRAVWQEAGIQGVDDLCIAVTQNHLGFYQKLLFECIGKGKYYKALNGVFAYPLSQEISHAQRKHRISGNIPGVNLRQQFIEQP